MHAHKRDEQACVRKSFFHSVQALEANIAVAEVSLTSEAAPLMCVSTYAGRAGLPQNWFLSFSHERRVGHSLVLIEIIHAL